MPTIFTHPAVPLALRLALGPRSVPKRLLWAGALAAILPDLDVVGFSLGIPYDSPFGHRGFSHSVFFALLVGLAAALFSRRLAAPPRRAFGFVFAATVSHGILDSLTTGGLGVAFLWPFSAERFFAPVRFIVVSPLSLAGLWSEWGWAVLESEILWVWIPFMGLAAASAMLRRSRSHVPRSGHAADE